MNAKGGKKEDKQGHNRWHIWLLANFASAIFFTRPPESQVAAVISHEKHLKTFEWDLELETQK